MLHGVFTQETLQSVCDDRDSDRKNRIESPADLTFGEYVRLLENPDQWSKLAFTADRAVFIGEMDKVRQTRNDVMHFDPDGIEDAQIDQLKCFYRLLRQLDQLSNGRSQPTA